MSHEASETPEPQEASAETAEPEIGTRLASIETALGTIGEILRVQEERITRLDSGPANDPEAPVAAVELEPKGLPEGVTRFWSPYRDYGLVFEVVGVFMIGGCWVVWFGKRIDFSNGIFDTNDPELAEYLRNHNAHTVDFWEAPDASPHAGPTVVDGPKSTGSSVRASGPRAELAARL